jgi:hypothetical protein
MYRALRGLGDAICIGPSVEREGRSEIRIDTGKIDPISWPGKKVENLFGHRTGFPAEIILGIFARMRRREDNKPRRRR